MIAFWCVAILVRDMEDDASAKKLLFAIGIANIINLASVIPNIINPEVNPPAPAVVAILTLTGLAFYSSKVSN